MSLFTKYIYTHIIMNKIAILAADGFEEIELKSPKIYLQNKGFQVDIVRQKTLNLYVHGIILTGVLLILLMYILQRLTPPFMKP